MKWFRKSVECEIDIIEPDEQLNSVFNTLNYSILAWLLLAVGPPLGWRWCFKCVNLVVLIYSAVYLVTLFSAVQDIMAESGVEAINFGSLKGVASLFRNTRVVLAGWTHYIAFDLFVASQCVQDSIRTGVPHFYMMLLLPVFLMAGPVGLVMYALLKVRDTRCFTFLAFVSIPYIDSLTSL